MKQSSTVAIVLLVLAVLVTCALAGQKTQPTHVRSHADRTQPSLRTGRIAEDILPPKARRLADSRSAAKSSESKSTATSDSKSMATSDSKSMATSDSKSMATSDSKSTATSDSKSMATSDSKAVLSYEERMYCGVDMAKVPLPWSRTRWHVPFTFLVSEVFDGDQLFNLTLADGRTVQRRSDAAAVVALTAQQLHRMKYLPCYNGVLAKTHRSAAVRVEELSHLVLRNDADHGDGAPPSRLLPPGSSSSDGHEQLLGLSCSVAVSRYLAERLHAKPGDYVRLAEFALVQLDERVVDVYDAGKSKQVRRETLRRQPADYTIFCDDVSELAPRSYLVGHKWRLAGHDRDRVPAKLPASLLVTGLIDQGHQRLMGVAQSTANLLAFKNTGVQPSFRVVKAAGLVKGNPFAAVGRSARAAIDAGRNVSYDACTVNDQQPVGTLVVLPESMIPLNAVDDDSGSNSHVVLHACLAQRLGVQVGDAVTLQATEDLFRVEERQKIRAEARKELAQEMGKFEQYKEEQQREMLRQNLWRGRNPDGWQKLYAKQDTDEQKEIVH